MRDLRVVDASPADIERRVSAVLDEHSSRLRQVDGVGSVTAVRLIGRTGRASRFPTADAFATYAGVAPIEIASGDRTRHWLSRAGDRRLKRRLANHLWRLMIADEQRRRGTTDDTEIAA